MADGLRVQTRQQQLFPAYSFIFPKEMLGTVSTL